MVCILMVEEGSGPEKSLMEEIQLFTSWNDVICPICLDFPHNSVLLQCSSHDKGCRPFVCDTDHLHSNCLDRFKEANMLSSGSRSLWSSENLQSEDSGSNSKPPCPLCRGQVTGWIVVDKARLHLDMKHRCCEEEKCRFTGTYLELQEHAEVEHPYGCPSKIDPARKLDWENFQQSSEIIDVLSTIHSEVPHGVVLGDYVIEYGDDQSGDDLDDFHANGGKWWTSCIFYQVFKKFRMSRNRRSRVSDSRRGNHRLAYGTRTSDEGSTSSVEYLDYNGFEVEGEFARGLHRGRADLVSSQRRRARFHDN